MYLVDDWKEWKNLKFFHLPSSLQEDWNLTRPFMFLPHKNISLIFFFFWSYKDKKLYDHNCLT